MALHRLTWEIRIPRNPGHRADLHPSLITFSQVFTNTWGQQTKAGVKETREFPLKHVKPPESERQLFFLKWKERVRQGKRAEKDPPEAFWTSCEAEILWSTPGLQPAKHARLIPWRKGRKIKRTSPQGILDFTRGRTVPFRIPRGREPGLKHILQGSESRVNETGEQGEHSNDSEGRHLNVKAWEVPYGAKS